MYAWIARNKKAGAQSQRGFAIMAGTLSPNDLPLRDGLSMVSEKDD
jgi:hypothetical protein